METTTQNNTFHTKEDRKRRPSPVIKYLLYGGLFGLIFPLGATLISLLGNQLPISWANIVNVQRENTLLYIIDTAPLFFALFGTLIGRNENRLAQTNERINLKVENLRRFQVDLERQVTRRTEELAHCVMELKESHRQAQRWAGQFEASARVTRATASLLDPDQIAGQSVQLISDQFGHYHTAIYLLDETKQWAVLKATNSEGGNRLLAANHRLEVGQEGIVGFVSSRGEPRISLDTETDSVFVENPELVETRSEIAIPLIARDQIIGVLDVQSVEPNAFGEQDAQILQALADQVAVALDNSRLLKAGQTALQQIESVQQQYLRQAWTEQIARQDIDLYEYRRIDAEMEGEPPNTEKALNEGVTVAASGGEEREASLVTPIKIRGQVVGALGLTGAGEKRRWSDDEIILVETVADQVAQAFEQARLFDETQRRARRERLVSDISVKIRAAGDIDGILRTTVNEARLALGVTHGAIRLGTESHLQPPADQGEGED